LANIGLVLLERRHERVEAMRLLRKGVALDTALRAQGTPLLERIELPVPSGAGAIGVFHEEPAGVGAEETDAVQEKAWPPPAPDTEPAKERPGSPGSPGSPQSPGPV
jgi:hypothetical protein